MKKGEGGGKQRGGKGKSEEGAYGAWYRVQRVINNDCVTGYSGYTGYKITMCGKTQVQSPLILICAGNYRFELGFAVTVL